jgi:hypothetical protein
MKGAGDMIEAELAKGDMQEAFCLLKRWYQVASDTMSRPCPQTMAQQTKERVELYRQRDSPGELLPINLQGPAILDDVPSDHKSGTRHGSCRTAVRAGRQKCTLRTLNDGFAALHWRRTPRRGPTTLGKETTGAFLLASSRLYGCRAKSRNN